MHIQPHSALFSLTIFFSLQFSQSLTAETDAVRFNRPVRFNRDVRPILTDKCFACHGPDAKTVEGGLRLDLAEQATDQSLGAIVKGKPDESEVVRRIGSSDPDEVMPPPTSHKPLTEDEKQVLRRWIAQGAEYENHWAYEPMRRPADFGRPEFSITNLIDSTIQSRLDQEGVKGTGPADAVTLIRRLSLDLNGIPPTAEEVDAFVKDPSDDAYAALVDRLLGSPRFGERLAIYWLDLVRYADTVGYHGDQNVSQSPYRDYVINAFNANMPYDQFVTEQLAGDLLAEPTLQQIVASGYNRLNQTTEEGGSQAKEYLAIYFADRVRNVSQVYMGSTMGCAQCHDHKYDPFTMRDFYSLGAFFADLEERGVYSARSRPPMIRVPDQQLRTQLDELDQRIAELQSRSPAVRKAALRELDEWEDTVLKTIDEKIEKEIVWVDDELKLKANQSGAWNFVSGKDAPIKFGKHSRRQHGGGTTQHFFDSSKTPLSVSDGAIFFAWVYLDPANPPQSVMLQLNDGDWSQRKVWGNDSIEFGRAKESHDGYRRAGELPEKGKWVRLEVTAAEVGLTDQSKISGMAFTQFGGLAHWDKSGVITTKAFPADVAKALKTEKAQRTDSERKLIETQYLSVAPLWSDHQKAIAAKQAERQAASEKAPQTVISKSVKPRPIRILPRGNWMDDSGEIVSPAVPRFLGELTTAESPPSRLDLARWLCRSDNPLTARTMVNRIWGLLFGRGICASVDDLGGQGTYPSYPDLLDALAIEFVDSGWDIKRLIRSIVSSRAYRRSSTPTEQLTKRDPYNEWFARQGRFTADAEMVRDGALALSGLLVEKVGGVSARPYQPGGYYAQLNFPRRTYQPDQDQNQYRRGVYTHWQRTFLHPMLKAFDAPSREECTARRARSNTPLQALVLLNDPTFVEAARVFAERIMREGGRSDVDQIHWAYRQAVSREPDEAISAQLLALYQQHLEHYQAHPQAAAELIAVGQAKVATDLDAAELAAWSSVSRVIMNLHESITRY